MPDKGKNGHVSLKAFLLDALKREARGKRDFQLSLLRSQPKRCTSLFAWASDLNFKVYVEHLLVLLAEKQFPPKGETRSANKPINIRVDTADELQAARQMKLLLALK